ncbi:hypothetical protein D3C87_1528360 [compost metagenome]
MLAVRDQPVRLGRRFELHPEHAALHGEAPVQLQVALVQQDLAAPRLLERAGGEQVVEVGVGVQDARDFQPVPVQDLLDEIQVAAGIDHHGFFGLGAAQDGAVAAQGADGEGFDDHGKGLSGEKRVASRFYRISPGMLRWQADNPYQETSP